MKSVSPSRETYARYGVAIIAGLMLAASFPKAGLAGFAWVAPGLLLAAAAGAEAGVAFRVGYVGGLAHFLGSLYWLLHIPVPFAPIVGWLAFSAVLALYAGPWVWLCWRIFPKSGTVPDSSTGKLRGLVAWFAAVPWLQRASWCLGCGALWVAWEMIQARFLSGFPWNFLADSQYAMLPLIQVASITGVYGVSFLVAWSSVALLSAGAILLHRPNNAWLWRREFFIVLLVVVIWAAAGFWHVQQAPQPGRTLRVALIQPSIPQTVIWDNDEQKEAARFRQLLELTERAVAAKPLLVAWPEAAVPSLFRWSTNAIFEGQTVYQAITGLARRHGVWLVIGADDAELNDQTRQPEFYNSSFLISPDGRDIAVYRKQRLVMFGEYVPLSRTFPFLKNFTQVYGEFKPGKKPVTFAMPSLGVKTSVLICFEDVFPHLAPRHLEEDTDFLLNLTNNGWFGESAAQWQHAAAAVFRAVENRLPLVRAANNGLSCWVDQNGGLHEVYFLGSTDIYQAGFKIAEVPLLTKPRAPTIYHRYGDWFGWSCVGLAAFLCLSIAVQRYKRSRPETGGGAVPSD